jgi:hypothetical protein
MHRFQLFLTVLLLASLTVFAGQIRDGSLSASSNGEVILVRWLSDDETGVVSYEIERRSGVSGQFFLLTTIAPRGNNQPYEYVDHSAFNIMESIYQYQVKVVLASGSPVYYGPITVRHYVSNVRRTWGSIKAMFR